MNIKNTLGNIYVTSGLLVIFVVLLYFVSAPQDEFWWSDESRHAMDGVFFYDLFRDMPVKNLISYLEEYVVRFPAISFTWNLPFFAIISAPFYALLGVSPVTAQIVVLVFACVLSIAMFFWGKEFISPFATAIAVVLFFLNRQVFLWMHSVMLEVPAIAMMLLVLLTFKKYLHSPTYKWAIYTGLIGFAMLMTKQITLFVLPLLVVYAWYKQQSALLWSKKSWPAYFFILLGVTGIVVHTVTLGSSGFNKVPGIDLNIVQLLLQERLPLMLKALDIFLPFPIAILAIVGIVSGFNEGHRRQTIFLVSWVIFGTLLLAYLTASDGNALRYCIYIAPPLYLLAFSTFDYIPRPSFQYYALLGALTCLLGWSVFVVMQQKLPFLHGYDKIAKYVYQLPEKRPVLFCCDHDGNYIFSMRAEDNNRHTITLRADKILVTIIISPLRGVQSHVTEMSQILQVINRFGVGYLVIEEGTYADVQEFQLLRDLMHTSSFEKIRTFNIVAGNGSFIDKGLDEQTEVNIYHYKNAKPIKDGKITIPLPRFNREAVLEVN